MTKIVSAYEARTHLGELLNQVYYQGEEIIISKSGKNIARIIKEENKKTSRTKKADSLWKEMRRIAKMGRQDVDLVAFIRKDRDRGHQIRP